MLLFGAGCGRSAAAPDRCDPAAFRAVVAVRADRTEVTVCGTVASAGRVRRSRSGVHRAFIVDSGAGGRIEVDANLDVLGPVPVRRGESAVVRGEYYADPSGRQGIHWTHRTTHGTHPSGYLVLDGVTYR